MVFSEQTVPPAPQLIRPSAPVTLPLPLTVTVSSGPGGAGPVNVAVTFSELVFMVTAQVGFVLSAHASPVHLVNVESPCALAVRTTVEFFGSVAVHVAGQSMPPPWTLPFPKTSTVSRAVSVELAQA